MTDDSDVERKSLATAWPRSTLLLCIFHVLQAGLDFLPNALISIGEFNERKLENREE